MGYLHWMLDFIARHTALGYGGIFLVSLSESLALIGLFVPGTVIMFGVGAIVATGTLKLPATLCLAAAGAVAGDGLSYWLGRHYKARLMEMWPFCRYPSLMRTGEAFFNRHGGKSVLLGRFVGPVRPVIPVIAGMMGMKPLQFSAVNVLSAMGWALVYILPGVFFGTSLAVAGAVSTRLAALVFILAGSVFCILWLGRKLALLVVKQGTALLSALQNWALEPQAGHGKIRPMKRILSFFLRCHQGDEFLLGFLFLILFVAGWGFLGIWEDILAKDPLMIADQAVYHFFQSLRTSWADNVLAALTELGDSFVNVAMSGAVLAILLLKRRYRTSGFWVVAMLGGHVGVQSLKWLFQLPRPAAMYDGASAYGFPSGHAAMGMILYGFLGILLARGLARAGRAAVFSSAAAISLVLGFSRLYLGAHWLSDVLGGFFLGTAWVALVGIAYLKSTVETVPRRWLGTAAFLVLVLAGGWHIQERHESDLRFYAPRRDMQSLPLAAWQAEGWQSLPAWRIDLEGESEQPLTIQWAGEADDLAQILFAAGWRRPRSLSLKTFLTMLSPHTRAGDLPVLPQLHDGRSECLRLVYPGEDHSLLLRIWPSDFRITGEGGESPLFLGTVSELVPRQIAGLITLAEDTGNYDRPLRELEGHLQNRCAIRRASRENIPVQGTRQRPSIRWQGEVLLAGAVP